MHYIYYNTFKHYTLMENLAGMGICLFLIGLLFIAGWIYDKLTTYIKDKKW